MPNALHLLHNQHGLHQKLVLWVCLMKGDWKVKISYVRTSIGRVELCPKRESLSRRNSYARCIVCQVETCEILLMCH